jgi:hypothetical protein
MGTIHSPLEVTKPKVVNNTMVNYGEPNSENLDDFY